MYISSLARNTIRQHQQFRRMTQSMGIVPALMPDLIEAAREQSRPLHQILCGMPDVPGTDTDDQPEDK